MKATAEKPGSWEYATPEIERIETTMKAYDIHEITTAVSKCMGVQISTMRSSSRKSTVVRARWVVMYIARMKTGATLTEIGLALNRNHSSVIHGINTVKMNQALIDCARRVQKEMYGQATVDSYSGCLVASEEVDAHSCSLGPKETRPANRGFVHHSQVTQDWAVR